MPLPLDALLGFGQRLFRLRPEEAENALPSGLQASPVGCRQGRQHQHKTVRGRRLELVAESHLHPGQTPIWLRPMPFYYAQRIDARRPVPYSANSSRATASGTDKQGAFMPIQATEKIWHNGKWVNWDDAKLHVLSHVVSYGSAVFEGIRCYETKQGPAIFRLREHMQRLINSAKIYRMDLPYSVDQFANTACELVRLNKLNSCYLKPIVLRGYGEVGVNPLNSPIDIYMACWSWGAYLGPEALSKGVDVGVSSWTRIALDSDGHVSEGSGMNVFLVHDGVLYTPPLATSILPGITRDAVVKLATDLNIPFKETVIPREMLYIADEVFFVGTAVEITPIRSVDHIQIGKGVAGQ